MAAKRRAKVGVRRPGDRPVTILPREAGRGRRQPPRWPGAASARCRARRGSGGRRQARPSCNTEQGSVTAHPPPPPGCLTFGAQGEVGAPPGKPHPREAPSPSHGRHGPERRGAEGWQEARDSAGPALAPGIARERPTRLTPVAGTAPGPPHPRGAVRPQVSERGSRTPGRPSP